MERGASAGVDPVAPDEVLYRRLARSQINPDGSVNSSAFKRNNIYEDRISVDRARLTTPRERVDRAGRAGFRLGAFDAGEAIALGFRVLPDPIPGNPAHALVVGTNDQERSRALARRVRVVPNIESRGR